MDSSAQAKVRQFGYQPFRLSMDQDATKSGIRDITKMMAFEIGVCMCPRGKKEPHAIRYSSFIRGVQQTGPFKGRDFVRLKDFGGMDKTDKLSLSNVWKIDHRGYLKVYDDPKDPYSLVKLINHWMKYQLEPMMRYYNITDCPFFWRRAPWKILKVCFRSNS